jgi:hypothetical protein
LLTDFISPVFDLYTYYLLVNQGQTTATGLEALLEGKLKHDSVTRSLSKREYGSNDMICWHRDHCQKRTLKGINQLTAHYYSKQVSLPVGYEIITKAKGAKMLK